MDRRVPVILCVDVEPDDHVYPPDDPSPWRGFELLTERIERLRGSLSALTDQPARFTWFLRMDPQIQEAYGDPAFIADRHRGFFERVRERGDEVGVHPHAWRWDQERRVWIADHGDPDWVEGCVEMAFEAYRSRFGEPAPHHRFGGRFLSEPVLAAVERLGARVDLTIEPGEPSEGPRERSWAVWTGETPDYADVPRSPYHPDRANLRRAASDGGVGLWAIPLTSGRLLIHPRRLRRTARLVRHPARIARRPRRSGPVVPDRPYGLLAMWRDWRSPRDFWRSAFDSLRETEPPYLAFAIRSDTPIRPALARRFERIMAALGERADAERLVFTTPTGALRQMGLDP